MCGIFAIVNSNNNSHTNDPKVFTSFNKGKNRGPEFSILKNYDNIKIGFHRLAINGLNTESNQPFEINNNILICNGEIYNFKQLAQENSITLTTDSDCEIILHLYLMYGIEYTLSLLDGVFSFIIYDKNNNNLIIARDPYGVRPLYYFFENDIISFASELKALYDLSLLKNNIHNFIPGHYMIINNISNNISNNFSNNLSNYNYYKYTTFPCDNIKYKLNNYLNKYIIKYITYAVKKRVVGTCERPVGCLLSGGLDSSLIAALVNKFYKSTTQLQTFSIGLPGSEDLKYAAIVAKHLGTKHHEIILTEDQFFNAIPEVIKTIESYDTTTVRASVGNYLVGKYIKENTDCKVIFNGDGADELMGGYLYFKQAPNAYEFDKECRRLLKDIHMYDVLRSDRCISSHGLEPRTPFLDRKWVEFYLSIDKQMRFNTTKDKCEKYLIRKAFNEIDPKLLPPEILWRTKEAFSDGVSSLTKSWFQIIQDKINLEFNTPYYNEEHNLKFILNSIIEKYKKDYNSNTKPITYEQAYYRYIYNLNYSSTDHLIPYFWMPKYVDANDASARTLKIYDENNTNK
jgi:asparagine synthase (glutamine-hydrolysing)